MQRQQKMTPAEWEIMEAVWELGKAPSVRDVLEHAYPAGEKAYTTVQTIMNTLVKKGLLKREKIGLVGFYRPKRKRSAMVGVEMRNLAKRAFGGSLPALANGLIALDDLDLDELADIKARIAERERELREEGE